MLTIDGSIEHAGGSYSWTGRSAPAVPSLRSKGLPTGDLVSDTDLMVTDILSEDGVGLSRAAMKAVVTAGANSPDPATILQLAAQRLGAVTDRRGRLVRFAAAPEPDAVIDACGRWQMSALLAEADGLAPH